MTASERPTKPVTLAVIDGIYNHEVITGRVSTATEHQALTDLADLFRRAADQIETERDHQQQAINRLADHGFAVTTDTRSDQ